MYVYVYLFIYTHTLERNLIALSPSFNFSFIINFKIMNRLRVNVSYMFTFKTAICTLLY